MRSRDWRVCAQFASNNSQQNGAQRMKWGINACSWSRLQGGLVMIGTPPKLVRASASCPVVMSPAYVQRRPKDSEMAYECAIARARFGEVAHAPQVRDQRQHGFDRCRVGVAGAALEGGAFTHRSLSPSLLYAASFTMRALTLVFRRSPGVTNPRSDEAAEGRAGEDLGESGGHGLIEEKPRLLGEFDRHFEHNFIVQPEHRTAGNAFFFQQMDDADECQHGGVGALALDREVARLCVLFLVDLLVPGEAEDAADPAFGITPDDDVAASLACLRIGHCTRSRIGGRQV